MEVRKYGTVASWFPGDSQQVKILSKIGELMQTQVCSIIAHSCVQLTNCGPEPHHHSGGLGRRGRGPGWGLRCRGRPSEGSQWQRPREKVHTCSRWHFVPASIPYLNKPVCPCARLPAYGSGGQRFLGSQLRVGADFVIGGVSVDQRQGGAAALRTCWA